MDRRLALFALTTLPASTIHFQDQKEDEKKKKSKKQRERDWQNGKVLSAEPKDAQTFGYPMLWPMLYRIKQVWMYIIETETMLYELLWPVSMPLNVTINGPVRFAVDKNRVVYVIDDEDRENKLTLFRKLAKTPPDTKATAPSNPPN
jgi:hypothetical protein